MTTKIGIISDVHANPVPLQQALELFDQHEVSEIICAGDIAGYFDQLSPCIELLQQADCKTIIGNHDQSFIQQNPQSNDESAFLNALPETLQLTIEQKSIYVVHAQPPDGQHGGIKLLDKQGVLIPQQIQHWAREFSDFDYDVLIVGHTHQVFEIQLGNTLVINPGSSQFNHSCMILSLPELTVETFALENKEILKSWNFSHLLFTDKEIYPSSQ